MMACKLLPIGSVRYCLAPPLRFRVQSFNDWSATSSHVKLRISLTLAPVSSSVLSKSACHGLATARTLLMPSGVGTYLTYCSTAGLATKRQGFLGTASLCQFQSAFNVRMRRSAALPPRSVSIERMKLVAMAFVMSVMATSFVRKAANPQRWRFCSRNVLGVKRTLQSCSNGWLRQGIAR